MMQWFKLLRVSHWMKAVFVLLGFLYAGKPEYLFSALQAALAFCLLSSSVYIYNDMLDYEIDRLHPHKKLRPLASKTISWQAAIFSMILLSLISFILAGLLSKTFFLILCAYLLLNFIYNHVTKALPFWDVVSIALGFMLRILAGTIGIGLSISGWLLATATLLSFFIAFCKRSLEMRLDLEVKTRKALQKYSLAWLNRLIIFSGLGCFISYIYYTVQTKADINYFGFTLPFAALGLSRFARLSILGGQQDDPVKVFMSDFWSILNAACFVILTFLALWQ